jgi:hypothetical protein
MGLLKLGELKIIGDQFFLKAMVLEAKFVGLGLEEMLGPDAAFGTEVGLIFLSFEFFDLEFVLVSFVPLLLETLLNVL